MKTSSVRALVGCHNNEVLTRMWTVVENPTDSIANVCEYGEEKLMTLVECFEAPGGKDVLATVNLIQLPSISKSVNFEQLLPFGHQKTLNPEHTLVQTRRIRWGYWLASLLPCLRPRREKTWLNSEVSGWIP